MSKARSDLRYSAEGRFKHPSEWPGAKAAIGTGRVFNRDHDEMLPGAIERPCLACGKTFQPTVRRRALCYTCWRRGAAPF